MLRGNKRQRLGNKCLPVSEPMITTYTQHAHLLSILTYYEQTYPWIYSNYIQLYINRDYKHNWGDFYFPFPYEIRPSDTCKWIRSQKLQRENINRQWDSIIDFIIYTINTNNYFHTMINYFHVPISDCFHRSNRNHDIFVYGYDCEHELLYVSDFFKYGHYCFERISFKDFSKAFAAYNYASNNDYLNNMIYLYSYNCQCDYKFNVGNITKSIKSYLLGTISEYWEMFNVDNKENIVFGIDIYTTLKNYFTNKITENISYIDIRPFYLLYDHKKLMYKRLKYLYDEGYFKSEVNEKSLMGIKELEFQARNVINIIFKYNITKNRVSISKMINILENMKISEYDILNQTLEGQFTY